MVRTRFAFHRKRISMAVMWLGLGLISTRREFQWHLCISQFYENTIQQPISVNDEVLKTVNNTV